LELGRNRYDQPIRIGYPEELSTLGQQLEWLRRRLVNLEADKERFMRHVTHELKTPLASLKEGTELLADSSLGELNAQQAEVVGILQESTRDQEQMIMRLLSYAEWRLERRQDQPEWHNLQPLIEEAIAPSAMLRQAKQVELKLELDAQRIYGRRVALLEVLDNLLSNALKYAPVQSQVELRISSVGRATGSVCGISVRDHGPGVPADQQERIFLPFEQGEQPAESTLRGSGLGLAIVAEICNELGGSVHVEDAHPGARFVCHWPAPHAPTVNADEQAQEGA
jgi:two-component system sensor histidine kinase GlrK